MPRLRRSLPSLAALVTFEAAARLGGFTRAARELGVTQAAVSRQMRQLEEELQTRLFVRAHRRVELTPAGSVLAMAVGQSFERIGDAIDVIRRPDAADTLTIGATLAFSHFWLLPRLPAFRMQCPEVKLRVLSQDVPVHLRDGNVDLVIRYGKPPFGDGGVAASMPDEVYPVCSPAAMRHASSEELLRLPRIDSEAPDASWLTWRRWFSLTGLGKVADTGVLRFSHYSDAVYAAIEGQGVALGWSRLLERPLSDGRLVRLGILSVFPEERHNLLVPNRASTRPAARMFIDWMEALMKAPNV